MRLVSLLGVTCDTSIRCDVMTSTWYRGRVGLTRLCWPREVEVIGGGGSVTQAVVPSSSGSLRAAEKYKIKSFVYKIDLSLHRKVLFCRQFVRGNSWPHTGTRRCHSMLVWKLKQYALKILLVGLNAMMGTDQQLLTIIVGYLMNTYRSCHQITFWCFFLNFALFALFSNQIKLLWNIFILTKKSN